VRGYGVQLLQWLGERDRGYTALRRAGRAAIVMSALFAAVAPRGQKSSPTTRLTAHPRATSSIRTNPTRQPAGDTMLNTITARMIWTGDYPDALRQTSGLVTVVPDVLTGSAAAS
jgi:hypothetical protein